MDHRNNIANKIVGGFKKKTRAKAPNYSLRAESLGYGTLA